MRCPHCQLPLDVRLIKAPPMQPQRASAESADVGDVGELLSRIHDDDLEPGFEEDFMRQTRERFAEYGERIRMSDKQMTALRRIAAK